MASITGQLVGLFFKKRLSEIDFFKMRPLEVQARQLEYLIKRGAATQFGRERSLEGVNTVEDFQRKVELCDYDSFSRYIKRTKDGEEALIWPSPVKWFAKSSGTTGDKSKYIPVTAEGLKDCHHRGPKDTIAIFSSLYPDSEVYSGKTMTLGGSRKVEREGEILTGDLSAILIENSPSWAEWKRLPSRETALIADFDRKVQAICDETLSENVTAFAGVPSWNLVMMNKILDYTGASNLLEVWPNMELFIHGGMNFGPYREQYRRLIPSDKMKYMETYNASEGFFGINDDPSRDDMLLMLDYRIFYEFLPLDKLTDPSAAVPLEGVVPGVDYAMVITTSSGLWRYMIGDVVTFTSTSPHRIRITGRTRHFINAFGEEVIVDNAERALTAACEATGAEITDYTVAPVYMEGRRKGAHEWVVEFRRAPSDQALFVARLDAALQDVNSDYEAKRIKNVTLMPPRLSVVSEGTFMQWMREHGKLGGQNKMPRLYNDRRYVDELLAMSGER